MKGLLLPLSYKAVYFLLIPYYIIYYTTYIPICQQFFQYFLKIFNNKYTYYIVMPFYMIDLYIISVLHYSTMPSTARKPP